MNLQTRPFDFTRRYIKRKRAKIRHTDGKIEITHNVKAWAKTHSVSATRVRTAARGGMPIPGYKICWIDEEVW